MEETREPQNNYWSVGFLTRWQENTWGKDHSIRATRKSKYPHAEES
jgi:hypothetical protein